MGLINKHFRRKPIYRTPEDLRIYPGQIKYKIYKGFCEGKTAEQIYWRIFNDLWNKNEKDAIFYIKNFHKRMKGKKP